MHLSDVCEWVVAVIGRVDVPCVVLEHVYKQTSSLEGAASFKPRFYLKSDSNPNPVSYRQTEPKAEAKAREIEII